MGDDRSGSLSALGGSAMFDLNESLKEWKRSFGGGCSSEDLEELESHLLEYFYDFRETGSPEEEAFDQAVAQMGNPKSVGIEFGKVRSLGDWASAILVGLWGLGWR